jgi:tetratricopeptide (TPR) repeat protein
VNQIKNHNGKALKFLYFLRLCRYFYCNSNRGYENEKNTFIFLTFLTCSVFGFGQADTKTRSEKAKSVQEDSIDAQITEVTKAIELEPNNPNLYLKRAYSYRLKHAAELVSSDVIKALGINPRDISVQLRAVLLLSDVERCEHALAIINTTIADNQKNDEAFDWRFRVKTCLGDTTGALDDVNKALSLNPQSSVYRTNQAMTLRKLGEAGKAAENFDKLVNSLEQKLSTIRWSPPLILTKENVDVALRIFDEAIAASA